MKKIRSYVFLIWFFGTMSLMYFSNSIEIILILFGQLFFVIGLFLVVDLKKKHILLENLVSITVPIIGVVTLLVGIFMYFDIILFNYLLLVPILFIIVPILIIISNSSDFIFKIKRCNLKIKSVIIDEQIEYGIKNGVEKKFYFPKYEINYNNMKIHFTDIYPVNKKKYYIGEERDIYINPNKPDDFIDKKNIRSINWYKIIGLLVTIVSGMIAFYYSVFK